MSAPSAGHPLTDSWDHESHLSTGVVLTGHVDAAVYSDGAVVADCRGTRDWAAITEPGTFRGHVERVPATYWHAAQWRLIDDQGDDYGLFDTRREVADHVGTLAVHRWRNPIERVLAVAERQAKGLKVTT